MRAPEAFTVMTAAQLSSHGVVKLDGAVLDFAGCRSKARGELAQLRPHRQQAISAHELKKTANEVFAVSLKFKFLYFTQTLTHDATSLPRWQQHA
jgi:hypothetical protein